MKRSSMFVFMLAAWLGGVAQLEAVSLTSPEGAPYVGNQLKFFTVQTNGEVSTTKDAELSLYNTNKVSFRLSGLVWLNASPAPAGNSQPAPEGFALWIGEKDADHRYELTPHALVAKRVELKGVPNNDVVSVVDLGLPVKDKWIPFSVEVTSAWISYQFGDKQGVIPGPLDTDGTNSISLSAGSGLANLQLEILTQAAPAAPASAAANPAPPTPANSTASPFARNGGGGRRGRRGGRGQAAQLQANFVDAVVLVEGDNGVGSGFIADMHDQFFIVTNQHVLSGNSKFTVTGMDGTKYPTDGPLWGAVDSDVAILRIPTADHFISVDDNAEANAKINDPVMVLGNAQGGGVVTQTTGKLLGIGPQLVEVNAKFVHGNSGSPIIDNLTRQVVGIATYTIQYYNPDDLQKAAQAPQLRWFGYRLDTIKQWNQLDWVRFSSEGQQLAKIQDRTDSFVDLLLQMRTKPPNLVQVKDPQINQAYSEYLLQEQRAVAANNRPDFLSAAKELITSLNALMEDDLAAVSDQDLYPFHATEFKYQQEVRKVITQSLQEVIVRIQSTSDDVGQN
jgi:S1-C subfamily serine protease